MPLHPFMEALIAKMADRPELSAGSPDDARALVAAGRDALGQGPQMHRVDDLVIQGRHGQMRGRYYCPTLKPAGLILYMHGGGWVVGALDDYDAYVRSLANETGFGVLSLDYRLAPEHRFPAGLEDTEDALAACIAGSIGGVDIFSPLVVAGDSAGANLATVAARRSPNRGTIALQALAYPVADCDFATSSYRAHGEGLPLTAKDMRWFFNHYAGQSKWEDADISPLRANDLEGMPPAIVVTAEYDVLCDEGDAYAERLATAGVDVVHRRLDGLTHGFVRLHNLFDAPRRELEQLAADITTMARKRAAKSGRRS